MDHRRAGIAREQPSPATIDFLEAQRRVGRLVEVPSETRHRAFSVWVALFNIAELQAGRYVIERSTHAVAAGVEVSRQSWLEYRDLLRSAGLLHVGPRRGPRPQTLTLDPPELT